VNPWRQEHCPGRIQKPPFRHPLGHPFVQVTLVMDELGSESSFVTHLPVEYDDDYGIYAKRSQKLISVGNN